MDKHLNKVPGYEITPFEEGRTVTAIADKSRFMAAQINLGGGPLGDQMVFSCRTYEVLGWMQEEATYGYTGPHAVNPGTPKYKTVFPFISNSKGFQIEKLLILKQKWT